MQIVNGFLNKLENKDNNIIKNTFWMIISQAGRIITQGIYFLLLAKILGVVNFGAFSAAIAFISIFTPFAGWGSGNVLIKNVAKNQKQIPYFFGNSIIIVLISGTIFSAVSIILGKLVLPNIITIFMLLTLALAEMIFGKIVELCGQVFQSFELLKYTALINFMVYFFRLISLLIYIFFIEHHNLHSWFWLYLFSSIITSLISLILVIKLVGIPKPNKIHIYLKEGFFFSFGVSSKTIYTDIDKTMLSRMTTLETTGSYSIAYKVINFSFIPVVALLSSTYARFFKYGNQGLRKAYELSKKIFPYTVLYGAIISFVIYHVSPIIPEILGDEYAESIKVIRILTLIPFIQSIYYPFVDTLTGAGYQSTRSLIQFSAMMINIILNLVLIPYYSWYGAALATIACEIYLSVLIIATIKWKMKKEYSQY